MRQELAETRRDTPATAQAYEYYLRANQLSAKGGQIRPDASEWQLAQDFYQRCVEEDPGFAPAWAQLGQVYRLTEKYFPTDAHHHLDEAESALQRALGLNPDLSMAHKLYAYLNVDQGRASDAAVRLVEQARGRPADPELFAGLVHACRYCGLLEASVAAHDHVQRLDAKMPTSVIHTYWQQGDYARVAETEFQRNPTVVALAWMMLGRMGDIADAIAGLPQSTGIQRQFVTAVSATAQGRREEARAVIDQLAPVFTDPEGLFYLTGLLARLGEVERATALFERVVNEGFYCFPGFASDPWLDGLRTNPDFKRVLGHAQSRHQEAVVAFREAGGEEVLGLSPS